MTADLAYGFAITGADDVARSMQSVASQLERLTQRQRQSTQSSREMSQAGTAAAQQFQAMGQAAQQLPARFAGVASAIQSASSALGGESEAAGLVARVASSTAQFAAMGSMLGPAGAVIGGIAGFGIGVGQLVSAHREAGEEIRTTTTAIREEGDAADSAAESMNRFLSSVTTASRRGELSNLGNALTEMNDELFRLRDSGDALGASVLEERIRTMTNLEASLRSDLDEEERTTGRARGTGRGGGSRTDAAAEEARAWRELLTSINDTAEGTLVLIEEERAARSVGNESTGDRGGGQSRAQSAFGDLRTASFGETDFFGEQTRAMADFERSATGSLDAVIAAYERLAETSASSAREVSRSGNLMARGIEGVANDIGGAVGGDMLGAFDKAVGAWLDGSKSFVEAAEEMAKGVLKALVQEGIVQAVAETARAIADIAGYRYDSAALHFAAAAAWGAVAGVAGGIGAATGAFGGGGAGAQEAAGSRELADRNQGDQQQGGTTVIHLYPGGYITRDEVAGGMIDALNFAGRNGRTLDSRLLRGA